MWFVWCHYWVTLTIYFKHIIPPKYKVCIILTKEWKKRWKQCKNRKISDKRKTISEIPSETEEKFWKKKKKSENQSETKKKKRPAQVQTGPILGDAGAFVQPERAKPGSIRLLGPGPNPGFYLGFRVSWANLREVKLCFVFRLRQFKGTLYHNVQHLGVVLVVRLRWLIISYELQALSPTLSRSYMFKMSLWYILRATPPFFPYATVYWLDCVSRGTNPSFHLCRCLVELLNVLPIVELPTLFYGIGSCLRNLFRTNHQWPPW